MKKCCKCKVEKEDGYFSKGQKACKGCCRAYYVGRTNRKCLKCDSICTKKRHVYCSNECKIMHNIKKTSQGCWEWQGYVSTSGYGITKDYDRIKKNISVHRLSYLTFISEITEGLCVCHECDNRKCCNPQHLWIGTHHENSQDCLKKGRNSGGQPGGEKNPASKLNEEKVLQIRRLAKSGVYQREIAKKFSISQATANQIINRKLWICIPEEE